MVNLHSIRFIFIGILLVLLSSCWKIQPDTKITEEKVIQNKVTTPRNLVHNIETFECGIITCNQKDILAILKDGWNLKLPNLDYYKKRFWVLIDRYKTFETLVSAPDYQKFVEDLNIEFFNCSGDFRNCDAKEKKYDQETMNYLFYLYIPQMVIEEYKKRWTTDMIMIEDVIQSIKRKDYTIRQLKDSVIEQYAWDLENKYKNLDLTYIDKAKLKSDNEYFKKIILWNGDGLFYKFLNETQNVKLNRISEEQMEEILNDTFTVFFHKLDLLWISKEEFNKKLSKLEVENKLKDKINKITQKYKLDTKLPKDRFLRNDELYIFNKNNISKFEKETFWESEFLPEIKEIRDLSYLLYVLWEEENLFFFPNLVKELKFDNNYIYLNLFDYAKQIKYNTPSY